MKKILFIVLCVLSTQSIAHVTCVGKIEQVVKWDHREMSVLLEGTTRWIQFPNDSDYKSMALAAFAAQKTVTIYWSLSDVNECVDGWSDYRIHKGYFKVEH